MSCRGLLALLILAWFPSVQAADSLNLDAYDRIEGFIDLYWDEEGGRMLLAVDAIDQPFIYQSSLARGVGSNDLGLDRGQLGEPKVVRFLRSGPKLLLVEDNLAFRAGSESADERQAIEESFARSVIWGFEDLDPSENKTVVDATSFIVRDAHGISGRLSRRGEGSYSVDASRSAIFMPRTKGFPDNTEAEALVTLVGQPTGDRKSVV